MLDVRLITILPQLPAIKQPSQAPQVSTQGASILAKLPTGSLLSGFIINRDPTGNPVLRTASGDVVFSSQFFLKIGSEVTIRIQNNQGNPTARILTVDGLPPEVAQTKSTVSGDTNDAVTRGNIQQSQGSTPTAKPLPFIGSTISSIVIVPATTTASNSPTSLPPGTSLSLSVQSVNQPAPTINTTNSALSQLSVAPPSLQTAPNTALTSLISTAGDNTSPPSQSVATATALSSPTPTQTAPNAAQNLQVSLTTQQAALATLPPALGQSVIASVVATSDDGSATLDTSLGLLRAINVGGVSNGDQLSLRVTSVGKPNDYTIAVAGSAPTPPLSPLITLAKSWPAMQQIFLLLGGGAGSSDATSFLPNLTQNSVGSFAGSTISSPLLSFISALKNNDFRGWIGERHLKALEEKGYGALIRKAEGEFLNISRQFAEPAPGQWQSLFFPVAVEGQVQQIRAFIKREKKKDEQNSATGEEDTRFVVEMELSELGELQMDGLVKRLDNKLKFDLIIRSHQPLQDQVMRDIEKIYHDTSELTGYSGAIQFQTVFAFLVNPLEETMPHLDNDVIA